MKKIATIAALVLLVGCVDKAEERKKIEKLLPSGCIFQDLGEYGEFDSVIVIICESKTTTTHAFNRYSCGKNSYCNHSYSATVTHAE